MTVSPEVLVGPRLKVERAERHIDELRSLTEPLSKDLYTIIIDRLPGKDTIRGQGELGKTVLVYRPLKPVPETLALVVGDALHNLRGALDHLATAVIGQPSQFHYPMCQVREDLISPALSKTRAQKTLAAIEKSLPGAQSLVLDQIRPANGRDDRLWSFHVLNNTDKHDLIIPTVIIGKIRIPFMRSGGSRCIDTSISVDAANPTVLAVLALDTAIEGDIETTVKVSFGADTPFQDEPVIPTLTQISGIVSGTIKKFETLIRNQF